MATTTSMNTTSRYDFTGYRIAAIVPCYNEEIAIAQVVTDLHTAVPGIEVYVYDNASTDATATVAAAAGAIVRHEPLKGKGNAVRRAFADVEADIYLMIDGDDTYDAYAAPEMIATLIEGHYDHILGARKETTKGTGYRPAHEQGNKVLNAVVGATFGQNVGDMLSGYRIFTRRFVKTFPAISSGFEIETELTVHALSQRLPQTSVEVGFKDRPAGSESKLHTVRDGLRILKVIASLARHERPAAFFGTIAALALTLSALIGTPTRLAHTPLTGDTNALLTALALLATALLAATTGAVLDTTRKSRHHAERLTYLATPALPTPATTQVTTPVTRTRTIPAPTAVPAARAARTTVFVPATHVTDDAWTALNRSVPAAI